MMRKALLALMLSTAAQAQQPAPYEQRSPSKNVVLAGDVHNNIDFLYTAIAQRANLEAAFCILGTVDSTADSVHLEMLVPVWIDSASGGNASIRTGSCTMPNTIGIVHFHPGVGFCRLSGADIASAHYLPWPVTAIVCTEKPGGKPKIVVVHKKVVDEDWTNLERDGRISRGSGGYTATYRYRKP
jgi:hypothetical protein